MKRTITVLGASALGLVLAAPAVVAADEHELNGPPPQPENGSLLVPGDRETTAENIVELFIEDKLEALEDKGREALLSRGGIITDDNVDALWTDRLYSGAPSS